jgi:predicted alpha/beta-hydrolase family hydrolase
MNHPFMTALANELAQHNIATLRFNFPFTEQKKKRPDFPAVAHKTIEVVINKVHELIPNTPLFVSGKSFGGRMSSQLLSKSHFDFVKGIIFFGFPLHPPGKPTIDRADHLKEVRVPMLFIQGTKDELATWSLIEKITNELSLATLYKLDGANHAFKSGKQNLIPVLAEATKGWIEKI